MLSVGQTVTLHYRDDIGQQQGVNVTFQADINDNRYATTCMLALTLTLIWDGAAGVVCWPSCDTALPGLRRPTARGQRHVSSGHQRQQVFHHLYASTNTNIDLEQNRLVFQLLSEIVSEIRAFNYCKVFDDPCIYN